MSVFKFTVYDFHEYPELKQNENGYEVIFRPDVEKDGWLKFKYCIDYNVIQITTYREYIVFIDSKPIECTRVFLTDGSVLHAVLQLETFEKNLNQFKEELKKATD